MGRNYDNWERLVEAVRRREQLRSLSIADSWSSSMRSMDSDFTSTSISRQDSLLSFRTTPSPLDTDLLKLRLKLAQSGGRRQKAFAKTTTSVWKRLSVFSGFSLKKENRREERVVDWVENQTPLHGLDQMKDTAFSMKEMSEEAKRRNEIARLRELHTLKGHIESLAKAKGIDLDTIDHYYTV